MMKALPETIVQNGPPSREVKVNVVTTLRHLHRTATNTVRCSAGEHPCGISRHETSIRAGLLPLQSESIISEQSLVFSGVLDTSEADFSLSWVAPRTWQRSSQLG